MWDSQIGISICFDWEQRRTVNNNTNLKTNKLNKKDQFAEMTKTDTLYIQRKSKSK